MKGVISDIEQKRLTLLRLFISSIALALAINLIVMFLTNPVNEKLWALITGCAIIFVMLIFYVAYTFMHRKYFFRFEPIVVLEDEKKLVSIPGYDFSVELARLMDSAFSEDEGLKNVWQNTKLTGVYEKNKTDSTALFEELAEYYVLRCMSMYTSDFFNKEDTSKYCATYNRDNLASLVLKNRFIKLFSESTSNRKAFNSNKKETEKDDKRHGILVLAYGKNGARYERFDFTLPKGAKIKKIDGNTVVFNFKHFEMTLETSFTKYGRAISPIFMREYADIDYKIGTHMGYEFFIDITIVEKKRSLLFPLRKNEYGWIDGFLSKISNRLDFSKFMDEINWNMIEASLRIGANRRKKENVSVKKPN